MIELFFFTSECSWCYMPHHNGWPLLLSRVFDLHWLPYSKFHIKRVDVINSTNIILMLALQICCIHWCSSKFTAVSFLLPNLFCLIIKKHLCIYLLYHFYWSIQNKYCSVSGINPSLILFRDLKLHVRL